MVVDGRIARGSANMDYRSFKLTEINAFIYDPVVATLEETARLTCVTVS